MSFRNLIFFIALFCAACGNTAPPPNYLSKDTAAALWYGPNHILLQKNDTMEQLGYQLVSNTAYYLGPQGTLLQISNGMNCQNCHLQAGTRPWGNNYGAVAATYPKFRDRSGAVESIAKRVNDCIERSLNGKAIDTAGREMRAFVAYIKWLGKDVPKGIKPAGSGIKELPFLTRAASSVNGKAVYTSSCARCHGENGAGIANAEGYGYTYPPLWGSHSYNTGAGMYRLSRLAGYVFSNMPFTENMPEHPQLSAEEAWDVAAYVNTQPRPVKDLRKDWPNIAKKPYDHPFGPYKDTFSEQQHKLGPFQPVIDARQKVAGL